MVSTYFIVKSIKKKRKHRKKNITRYIQNPSFDSVYTDSGYTSAGGTKCRVCLKTGNIPLFGAEISRDLTEALCRVGDVEINIADDYPKHLCNECFSLLQGAIQLRNLAKKTDKLLHTPLEGDSDNFVEDTDTHNEDNVCRTYDEDNVCSTHNEVINMKLELHKSTRNNSSNKKLKPAKCKKVCIECPKCFKLVTANYFEKHLSRHVSESHFVCEVCGKLSKKENILRHAQIHSIELPFKCKECPYRGRFSESLKIHMRTHTGEKPFSCDKCHLRCLTRANLNRHLLTHQKEKPFKCEECGKGFYRKQDMNNHFRSDHEGIKDFFCSLCTNQYGSKKALLKHELRVHKREPLLRGMPLYLQPKYKV